MKYTLLLFRDALFWVLFLKLGFFSPPTSMVYVSLDFTFMGYLFSLR